MFSHDADWTPIPGEIVQFEDPRDAPLGISARARKDAFWKVFPMTITAEADPRTGWVHVRAAGPVSRADVAAHLKDLATRGLYGLPRLVDARGSTISMNRDEWLEIVILVRQLQIRCGMSSVALVAPDDTAYDLVRTNPGFGASIDPVMQIFRDAEDAAAWLRERHTRTQPLSPPG